MSMPRSLRSRLILASVLWTAGLLMLLHMGSLHVVHAVPALRGSHGGIVTILGVAILIAGLAAARSSLTPFLALREKIAALRAGRETRIDGAYPTEVQPLIDSLNALLADREKALERARLTAGDLAHGLKTPLALLSREAAMAREAGHGELAAAIEQHIRRMSNQVDYHLARARVAASGPNAAAIPLSPCIDSLVRTLRKLHAARTIDIQIRISPEIGVRVNAEDVEEILGNLLDNACKWAKTRVTLAVDRMDSMTAITIEDDGPGLAADLRQQVLQRGVRVDEAVPGSGLGLSIARDLTEHYGGTIALEASSLGGLLARITLPAG
ncbi:MAG: hypothetical protein JNM66_24490 [Bryobacterales bacterium]|nr:hypothetical protein [Bryobacterales bacterium]